MVLILSACTLSCRASRVDTLLLRKLFSYAQAVDTSRIDSFTFYAYQKSFVNVKRRNALLLSVPSMFAIAHAGRRKYLSEEYNRIFISEEDPKIDVVCHISTFPRFKAPMPTVLCYLTPRIYHETLFRNQLLSPFNRLNRRFYRYKVYYRKKGKSYLRFRPKVGNTQLVSGSAIIDEYTGRVLSCVFNGEYDMIRFQENIDMSDVVGLINYPERVNLDGRFKVAGNFVEGNYMVLYNKEKLRADSLIGDVRDRALMDSVRPMSLTEQEQQTYNDYFKPAPKKDSTQVKRKDSWAKRFFWDVVGDHMLNRIKSRFGSNDQGYIRINPIFNPLYFGYSRRKGLVYKLDLRGGYNLSDNSEFSTRIKGGYSFKQHQFYYNIPITYKFNKRHDGYVKLSFANGNRISNSLLAEEIEKIKLDSINWDNYQIDYFRDRRFELNFHYDLNERIGLQIGAIHHTRKAVDKTAFDLAGKQPVYKSVAPSLEVEFRPLGKRGPILTCDYEHSFNGFLGSNMRYSRWEFDGQYIKPLTSLQSLSLRAGCGFYTDHNKNTYFLDYTNFRENNIPGGWNDDWSGEFELLNSNWYNASNYYIRTNVTYESPLLLLSWVPFFGHFIEMERIYASALDVKKLHPYIECGYGFTTRLFSVGLFVANKAGKFDGFGCKFGFELFRDW